MEAPGQQRQRQYRKERRQRDPAPGLNDDKYQAAQRPEQQANKRKGDHAADVAV